MPRISYDCIECGKPIKQTGVSDRPFCSTECEIEACESPEDGYTFRGIL